MLTPLQTNQNLSAFYLSKHKSSNIIYVLVLLAFTVGVVALLLLLSIIT